MPAAESSAWKPILSGPIGAQAKEVIQAIATACTARDIRLSQTEVAAVGKGNDSSLASGSAGQAIFHSYLARAGLGDEKEAGRHLEHAVAAVASTPMVASLYGGITGVAWSIGHLRKRLKDAEDVATELIDELLLTHLSRKPWRKDYDLVSGLVGFGVYALEQWPASGAARCLRLILGHLEEIGERTADGITWFTRPELLPPWQREFAPSGYFNLGLAHGVPGVIAFLGRVCALRGRGTTAAGLRTRARTLLDRAVDWLLAQKNSNDTESNFGSWIGEGIKREPSRVAWCYGDLGIALALFVAARSAGNANWENEAIRLAQHSAGRSMERSAVLDGGLCHGTAGVGHLFNRMFQATGDLRLREAACQWFQRTLEMRRSGKGIAGFSAWRPEGWEDEVGLLEGASGIALALLAATTPIAPDWDRFMLVSPT